MAGERVLVIDDSPTITKMVELTLIKAGYRVTTAADGEAGLQAALAQRPDLILLDFVMPKVNGYQFCRQLSEHDELREVPVVLMSAKGDQVGERFVKVMGIVDYITKPFAPDAVAAVVRHSIDKFRGPGASADDTTGRGHALAARQEPAPPATDDVLALLRDTLAELLARAGGEADAVRDDDLVALLRSDALEAAQRAIAPGLRGDLGMFPLAEVLQLLDAQEQTGCLRVHRGETTLEAYFRRGRIEQVVALGTRDEHLLGRFLVEAEALSTEALEDFLAGGVRHGLLGESLCAAQRISPEVLQQALARQSSELLYEALRWRRGGFQFTVQDEAPTHVRDAALALDVEVLLMEGFRRVDEWHLIERAIEDFDVVFLRNEDAIGQMGRGRLTREELAVLELVNGKNSIKEIVRKAKLGSFEVSKMLYRLYSVKLLRRRIAPIAV